ncbi:hypothetical protein [Pseudactinotalea sp. HY158]|uniref:hypothetical protein n=1 Tax=Pseudactinotalea sp. HY158 TaxID=2654547 RepID=UPI00129D20DD|nr:hypothetical protein [Pseudactinotalea sp. HY158]QGH69380.1 hypothetical protein GCE65_07520 [Pseudactinotalea sp. HY158]
MLRCRWCARLAGTGDDDPAGDPARTGDDTRTDDDGAGGAGGDPGAGGWRCPHCHGTRYRASQVGSDRTAEELGRAFPGTPVVVSGRTAGMVAAVDGRARLVIATPGAEPVAAGGYRAAICLDAALLTNRPELGAGVEALRRWLRAAALVRPDGTVMVLGQGAPAVVQALVRWDPAGFAARELAERTELGFPPATRMIAVTGTASDLRSFRRHCRLPRGAIELGPVPIAGGGPDPGPGDGLVAAHEPRLRLLLRIERSRGAELSAAVVAAQAVRSARKDGAPVHVRVDPDVV